MPIFVRLGDEFLNLGMVYSIEFIMKDGVPTEAHVFANEEDIATENSYIYDGEYAQALFGAVNAMTHQYVKSQFHPIPGEPNLPRINL